MPQPKPEDKPDPYLNDLTSEFVDEGEDGTLDSVLAALEEVGGEEGEVSKHLEGQHDQSSHSPTGAPASGREAASRMPKNIANAKAYEVAQQYVKSRGLAPIGDREKVTVDPARGQKIAEAYEQMKSDPTATEVVAAYKALGDEVQAQYDILPAKVEWAGADPYKSSKEMMEDVATNNRLRVFTGGEPHPLLGAKDKDGVSLNDKFRAVHDYFGHAMRGNQFGASGEENAWISHSEMFSPLAQRAMTTETRGQNSWFNFSRGNAGKSPQDRKFAEQKVGILPDEFLPSARTKRGESSPVEEDDQSHYCPLHRNGGTVAKHTPGGQDHDQSTHNPHDSGAGGKPDIGNDRPETPIPDTLRSFDGIKNHLARGTKIILSAENPKGRRLTNDDNDRRSVALKRILENDADEIVMQRWHEGGNPVERSYIATPKNEESLQGIADLVLNPKEFDQESIIVIRNGIAETRYQDKRPSTYAMVAEVKEVPDATGYYSQVGGIRYVFDFKYKREPNG
jgi:hypothetical protein